MIVARHAQSTWNVVFARDRVDPHMPDAALTEEGQAQAAALAARLAAHDITTIIASPYKRALQTARIVAARAGVIRIEVEPLVRERNAFSCDIGSEADDLRRSFPDLVFDHLAPNWWGEAGEAHGTVAERGETFLRRVARRDDLDTLAVISHWGFIRALTGAELANADYLRLPPASVRARRSA